MKTSTTQVEELQESFECEKNSSWYERVVDQVAISKDDSDETDLMKLVLEEMAQFYDAINEKEFMQIELKFPSSRIVLYKVAEKVIECDK